MKDAFPTTSMKKLEEYRGNIVSGSENIQTMIFLERLSKILSAVTDKMVRSEKEPEIYSRVQMLLNELQKKLQD